MDWSKVISKLEQANAALLDCPAGDLPALETGMAQRDAAIRELAGVDARELPPTLASRLTAAFERGAAVRVRLASIYRDLDAEMRRTSRIRTFFETHAERH